MAEIAKVGVIGAGLMGNGIAHVAALAGLPVVLMDVQQAALDKAMATMSGNMAAMTRSTARLPPVLAWMSQPFAISWPKWDLFPPAKPGPGAAIAVRVAARPRGRVPKMPSPCWRGLSGSNCASTVFCSSFGC